MSRLTDDLDGARTVLFGTSSMNGDRDRCTELLTDGFDRPNVLFVTYTRGAMPCLEQFAGDRRDGAAVITVGEAAGTAEDPSVETVTISTPSDLTGIGIEIGQFLSDWEPPMTVCFDSLTAMLQYVDFETAYEFLHTITGQVYAAGARAHFHVDPAAHDDEALAAITSLFDASVTVDEETTVRTRGVLQ